MSNKLNASEYIDECGITRFTVMQLLLVTLAGLFEGFDYMLVPYTMSQIAEEWNLNAVETGSLSSWAMIGLSIGGILGGYVADKIGRRKTMIWSVGLFSVFTTAVAFAPNYAVFAILRIIAGLFLGSVLPLTVSMAAEYSTTKRRTLVVGLTSGATPLGFALASVVAIFVIPSFGWRPVFLFAATGFILTLILIPFLYETPYWSLGNGKYGQVCRYLNAVRKSAKSNIKIIVPEDLYIPAPSGKQEKLSYKACFGSPKMIFITIGAAIIYFAAMFTMYGVDSWYPSLMLAKGLSIQEAYGFSMAMNLAGIIGNIAAGYFLQVFGRRKGAIIGFIAAFVFIIFMAITDNPIAMVVSAMLVGLAINYLPSSVNAVTPELFPTNARSSGVSFVMSTGRFAGFLSPILAGIALQVGASYSMLLIIFALPCLLGIVFVLFFLRIDNSSASLNNVK